MSEKFLKKAVFLDRDGTLIEDDGFLNRPDQIRFIRQTFEALRDLQKKYELFIVTNQPGISRGLITIEQARQVNSYIVEKLLAEGIKINRDYICAHDKNDNCQCRKPCKYFASVAAKEYNLDLSRSYSIGDHLHDVEFALNFGGKGLFVLTGHGRIEKHKVKDKTIIFENILHAAYHILES